MTHLKEGTHYKDVAKMIKVHEKSIFSWIHRFEKDELEGLCEKGDGRLMGKDAQEILLEKFNVKLSKNSVYALLHKIGLSWVSSRSRHPK